MAYLVLARKYRPQVFEEVVEQEHVTRTLANAITAGRLAHAILLSGPRGTGKTTVARILAKAMNCVRGPSPTPCNACQSCTEITGGNAADVFEIDGASNNSVDQVRELRENIKYMPAHSPYKIYIIDEVHMLSVAAFNALLKTLEEPPAHVLFFFATTEPHKIPMTILSRCQRHDFRRIGMEPLVGHLKLICSQEHRHVPLDVLHMVGREAGGSIRDALSLLDHILSSTDGDIRLETALDMMGSIHQDIIYQLAEAAIRRDLKTMLVLLDEAYRKGSALDRMYADLLQHFRHLRVVALGEEAGTLVDLPASDIDRLKKQAAAATAPQLHDIFDTLMAHQVNVRLAPDVKLACETAFFHLYPIEPVLAVETLIEKLDALRSDIQRKGGMTPAPPSTPSGRNPDGETAEPASPPRSESSPARAGDHGHPANHTVEENIDRHMLWDQVKDGIAATHPSLAACLNRSAIKQILPDRVVIEVHGNGFNVSKIKQKKSIAALEKQFQAQLGRRVRVSVISESGGSAERSKKKRRDQKRKQDILNHPLIEEAVTLFDGEIIDVKLQEEEKP